MAFQQFPQKGGIPSGATATRPANPVIGDTYYDGTIGFLVIFDGTNFIPCSAPASQPTITVTDVGTGVAYGTVQASVAFTEGTTGGKAAGFTATQSSQSVTSSSSPIALTITGNPGSYSFGGTAYNAFGTSPAANTVSQSLTSVPETPTTGASSSGNASVTLSFTAGATGGKTISNYKYSTDGTTYTAFSPAQTTSPLTVSGLTNGTSYTFRIKAVNANGDSIASSAYSSVTPEAPTITGGTLVTSGGFNYRIFTSNGTLGVTNGPVTVDVLAVGGGGGGGFGGGGAGALVWSPSISVASGNKTIVIGAGGAGNQSAAATTTKGGNTTFDATVVIAAGGGGGGRKTGDTGGNSNTGPGEAGGCGGGGGHPGSAITGVGGAANSALSTGTNIFGNNGGNGYDCCNGGGGGGTGLAGGNADGDTGTGVNIGGDGKTNWLSASTSDTATFLWAAQIGTNGSNALVSSLGSNPGTIYLGGGGGGAYGSARGGYGGGGTGGVSGGNTSGVTVGAANTGSGGGAANAEGRAGGSGVLIVRYA
jgi:hypothetical protein